MRFLLTVLASGGSSLSFRAAQCILPGSSNVNRQEEYSTLCSPNGTVARPNRPWAKRIRTGVSGNVAPVQVGAGRTGKPAPKRDPEREAASVLDGAGDLPGCSDSGSWPASGGQPRVTGLAWGPGYCVSVGVMD